MITDVRHASSSSSSVSESVTGGHGHNTDPLLPQPGRSAPFLGPHPTMGDPFDVIPYDVRSIFSASQFTHKPGSAGYQWRLVKARFWLFWECIQGCVSVL
jgi:hypothetical protein